MSHRRASKLIICSGAVALNQGAGDGGGGPQWTQINLGMKCDSRNVMRFFRPLSPKYDKLLIVLIKLVMWGNLRQISPTE